MLKLRRKEIKKNLPSHETSQRSKIGWGASSDTKKAGGNASRIKGKRRKLTSLNGLGLRGWDSSSDGQSWKGKEGEEFHDERLFEKRWSSSSSKMLYGVESVLYG